ncbi:MAG: hypothetical protein WA634_16565 [Silvibacterium sp.]
MNTTKAAGGLRLWQHAVVFLVACLIFIARRPDAIFHAQFYAEDGRVWFANAYNLGWFAALLRPQYGYFQMLPRLGAALALLVPFFYAPLVLNLIAILFQALPVNILLSTQSSAWGSLRFRIVLAAVYVVLPNCWEISCGITESQWVLGLSAFLVLVACPSRSAAVGAFDVAVLLLYGLSGPFSIFLLAIAIFLLWRRRTGWCWTTVGIFSLTTLIQAWAFLIRDPGARHTIISGASPAWFIRILSGSVYLGTLIGGNDIGFRPGHSTFIFLLCVAIAGTAIVTICIAKANVEMKLLLIFSAMIFAATLVAPNLRPIPGLTGWQELTVGAGMHYWFFPTLAFAWSVLWCFRQQAQVLKVVSTPLLFLMCFGIIRDLRRPAFTDLKFAEYAERLKAAPAGAVVIIPINPVGWNMVLRKH